MLNDLSHHTLINGWVTEPSLKPYRIGIDYRLIKYRFVIVIVSIIDGVITYDSADVVCHLRTLSATVYTISIT